jgi:hypothetical protein
VRRLAQKIRHFIPHSGDKHEKINKKFLIKINGLNWIIKSFPRSFGNLPKRLSFAD